MVLEIHGEWRLKVVRDAVMARFSGAWNEEAAAAYFAEYQPATAALTRYCTLIRYDHWGGFTPEAAAILARVRRWAHDHGCVCAAWVLEEPLMRKWMEMVALRTDGLHEVRVFAALSDATAWLATKGFAIDPADAMGGE